MNRLLWGVGILCVVLYGMYFLQRTHTTETRTRVTSSETVTPVPDGPLTWADLMRIGGDHVCTFSAAVGSPPTTGTVYVSGEDVRADLVSTDGHKQVMRSILKTRGFLYTWTNLSPRGNKIPFATEQSLDVHTLGTSVPENLTLNCATWNKDTTRFSLPKVDFLSPSTSSRQ